MLAKYMFGSNTHILGNLGKDIVSSLAQVLQNTRIKPPLTFLEI